jgi:uncharacterized RDD family membrane protein YckC
MIDYFVIALYGTLLFFVVSLIGIPDLGPISGQIVAFFTLTLPVFLYFLLMERSSKKGTFGKQLMKLKVLPQEGKSPNYFKRNLLKFLPWEIAHTGIHWMYYFDAISNEPPLWLWFVLILPQIAVFIYFVSIVLSKGSSSFYDQLSFTMVKY